MRNFFNIPKHIMVDQITDTQAHYYGNIKYLTEIRTSKYYNMEKSTVMSINIGTSINAILGIASFLKEPYEKVWEIKYNGKTIRTALMKAKDSKELIKILDVLSIEAFRRKRDSNDFYNLKWWLW